MSLLTILCRLSLLQRARTLGPKKWNRISTLIDREPAWKSKLKMLRKNNLGDIPSPSPRVSCKSCDFWEGVSSILGANALSKEEDKKLRIDETCSLKAVDAWASCTRETFYGKKATTKILMRWQNERFL